MAAGRAGKSTGCPGNSHGGRRLYRIHLGSKAELRLRRCGYFLSLSGHPETQNTTAVTVYLPRADVFASDHLRALMERAERGEPL